MKPDREVIENELKSAKVALKSYEEGAIIQKRVVEMFEKWLKEYPEKAKDLNKSTSIG